MNPIEKLEALPMMPDDKANILLVHGGLKPSTMVVMQGEVFALNQAPIHVDPESIAGLKGVLTAFDLQYTYTTEVMENASDKSYEHGQEVMRIYIAPQQEVADQLGSLFGDIKNHHHEIGVLLGYPKTAVDAFLTDDMLAWSDHPVSTSDVSATNMKLLGHRLSKQYWKDEVKYLEAAGAYINSVSPAIYATIVK